jgi:hypothetical protein
MWFLFVEIFFLLSVSFAIGAAVTLVGLKTLLRPAEGHASDAGRVVS